MAMFSKSVTFPDAGSRARFIPNLATLDPPHRHETVTIVSRQEPPPRHPPLKDPMMLVRFDDGSLLYAPLSLLLPA